MPPPCRAIQRTVPAAANQCLAKQELDLAIEAAELIRSPTAQFLQIFGIQAQEECLSLSHVSLIDRAGIHHRLGRPIAAQDHEQIAHHRSPALFIQLDDFVS